MIPNFASVYKFVAKVVLVLQLDHRGSGNELTTDDWSSLQHWIWCERSLTDKPVRSTSQSGVGGAASNHKLFGTQFSLAIHGLHLPPSHVSQCACHVTKWCVFIGQSYFPLQTSQLIKVWCIKKNIPTVQNSKIQTLFRLAFVSEASVLGAIRTLSVKPY